MWWTILSWTHTSFLLEVRQRLQHITFYIDILQFSINENYDKHKKRSCMEVPYSFMTCPGIEPGFTPWEGVVLTAWPTGLKSSIEATWFEHATSASRTQRSTKLSHASMFLSVCFALFTSDLYILSWLRKKCKRFLKKMQIFKTNFPECGKKPGKALFYAGKWHFRLSGGSIS